MSHPHEQSPASPEAPRRFAEVRLERVCQKA